MQKESLKAPSIAFIERDFEKAGKLPKPKIYKSPPIDDLFRGIEDVGIGPEYFAHIRKGEYHVEFGGPKTDYLGCTFIDVCSNPNDVEDAVVKVYGPELNEIDPESTLPAVIHVKAWGKDMSFDHMEYLGRIVANGMTSVEGMTFLGGSFDLWFRISKKMVNKHNFSLGKFGQIYRAYVMTTVPLVEKMEVIFIVGEPSEGGVLKDEYYLHLFN
jgi:CO dehydrogenase/acetyl-CoA synthase beta subunit